MYLFFILAHIFFDDAYEISDASDDWMQINEFVKLFVGKYQKTYFLTCSCLFLHPNYLFLLAL